jgi:hypothetical protein
MFFYLIPRSSFLAVLREVNNADWSSLMPKSQPVPRPRPRPVEKHESKGRKLEPEVRTYEDIFRRALAKNLGPRKLREATEPATYVND